MASSLTDIAPKQTDEKFQINSKDDTDIILNEKFWPLGRRKMTWKEQLALGVGITCVILNFVAFVVFGFVLGNIFSKATIGLMACISLITAPLMVWGETELTKVDALREVVNDIRDQVNRMMGENDKLTASIDELEENKDRLKELESGLSSIAQTQGQNVASLMNLVKENGEIQKGLRKAITAQALQSLIFIIMDCDKNFDFMYDEEEIDRLVLRMSAIEEIEFDETSFRKLISKGNGSVDGVLELIKGLIDDDDGYAAENTSVKAKTTTNFLQNKVG